MNNPTDTPLVERLYRDAVLCRAESFHSTALLLDEAAEALTAANARIRDLEREVEWQPIESAPHNKPILAFYLNSHGKGRTMRATLYDDGVLDYDGDDLETEFAPAGWYETPVEYEHYEHLSAAPTHWMPLPKPPRSEP